MRIVPTEVIDSKEYITRTGEGVRNFPLPWSSSRVNQQSHPFDDLLQQQFIKIKKEMLKQKYVEGPHREWGFPGGSVVKESTC